MVCKVYKVYKVRKVYKVYKVTGVLRTKSIGSSSCREQSIRRVNDFIDFTDYFLIFACKSVKI